MNFPLFYFGNIAYWKDIIRKEEIVFSNEMYIPKKSYCNRTIILSPNEVQSLSVPLQGGRGKKINYKDVRINYSEDWVKNHLNSLQTSYASSPFYEFYIDEIRKLLTANYELLIELNSVLFNQICQFLKLKVHVSQSENYQSCIDRYTPNEYRQMKEYPQVFEDKFPFQSDLSILDLIFNLGPEAKTYLFDE